MKANWRIGVSRIMIALWIPWAAFVVFVEATSGIAFEFRRFMVMAGLPLLFLMLIGWVVSWIIDGFSGPKDHYQG